MQIRIVIVIIGFFLILEILASFFVYFDEGKVVNVKELFLNIPEDFPSNFYILVLKAKNPHFYDFFYHLILGDLYSYSQVSKYKLVKFEGFNVKDEVQFYGRSEMLCLILAFWAYEKGLKFSDNLKIGVIGDVSKEGEVLSVAGASIKYSIALENDINILIAPIQNKKEIKNFDNKSLYCLFVRHVEDAKKNLLKFVSPKVVNVK
ncbi:MAG: hypothetical protein ACP5J9_03305 [Dictyoglomus sp.]